MKGQRLMMIFDYELAFKIAVKYEIDFMLLKRCNCVGDYNKYYVDGNGIMLSNDDFIKLKGAIDLCN